MSTRLCPPSTSDPMTRAGLSDGLHQADDFDEREGRDQTSAAIAGRAMAELSKCLRLRAAGEGAMMSGCHEPAASSS